MMMSPFGNDPLFTIMPILFGLFFVVVLGIIVFALVRGAREAAWNRRQPILNVTARIIGRRQEISHSSDSNPGDGIDTSSTRTTHFVTFEVESGDRMEFAVQGKEYGLLIEGDYGKLTFQGTRYIGFVRDLTPNGMPTRQ